MSDLKEDAYDSEDAANPASEDDVGKDEDTVDEDLTDDDDDGASGEKGAVAGQKLQAKWDEMYKRLLKFKEKHGHCLVPNRYAEDPQLGSWVSTQRRHYKILTSGSGESTPMTPARAQKLVEIGFKWSTKDPRHVPWEHRYKELIAFKEKYGHAQVPIGWEENVQLSNWVSTQRQEYKLIQRGRQSRLTQDRIDLLNKVDFVWEAQRGGPRRKRKATVAVPPKANPVDMGKLRAKAARGKPASALPPGGTFLRASALQQGANGGVDWQQALAAIGGTSVIPGTVTIPASQWQLLANGAFQKAAAAPQAALGLGAGASLFPLASQIPLAASGFQFGANPLLAQLQQQQQAALLFNAGVLATGSPQLPEEGRKRSRSEGEEEEEEEDQEEEVKRKPRGKKRRNSGARSESSGEREGDVFYDATS